MIGLQNQVPLKSLTARASLVMLLRTLYRMGLNYCVLLPSGDYAYALVFTKDQLVSLIERGNSDMLVADIPKSVTQGFFKPAAIFKPDEPDFVPDDGEPEQLQVLLLEEGGAKVSSLKDALVPRAPEFPGWWEAPVPFAMLGYGKLHINHTALLMFGSNLERMPIEDIPDKDEFLITLEGETSHCSVTFRRLEGDIFALEDSTSDLAAAEEVAWWAAIGKAWTVALDLEKRAYSRCSEGETENLNSEDSELHPCEWGGELLGYFRIENKTGVKSEGREENETPSAEGQAKNKRGRKKVLKKSSGTEKNEKNNKSEKSKKNVKRKKNSADKNNADGNDALNILGPQTLGLLAPGIPFDVGEGQNNGA